jgi:thiol-disulfide isomerase/thioredoxin
MTPRRTLVAALMTLAVVALSFTALGFTALGFTVLADESEGFKLGEFIPAASPQPAPEISLTDLAGNTAALADFKGKFVLLNLWATWCQPCIKEMPSLAALRARLGPALTIVAVSEDRGGEVIVKLFIEKLGLEKFKVYLDPKSTATRAFQARGLPTSFLIDGEGKVLGRVEGGADWDSEPMRATLARLMPPR